MGLLRDMRVAFGLGLLVLCVVGLGVASLLSGGNALVVEVSGAFEGVSAMHWLGTDDLGRDVLARLAVGVRTSLVVSAVVLVVTGSIGITLGLVAGWFGGWVDVLVGKMTEVVLSFPGLLLALALAALVGPGMGNVMVALGLLGWVGFCRLTRVEVKRLRGLAFVQAARLGGASTPMIWGRHILPNCVGPLLVEALLVVAGDDGGGSGIEFFGIGDSGAITEPWRNVARRDEGCAGGTWVGGIAGSGADKPQCGYQCAGAGFAPAVAGW